MRARGRGKPAGGKPGGLVDVTGACRRGAAAGLALAAVVILLLAGCARPGPVAPGPTATYTPTTTATPMPTPLPTATRVPSELLGSVTPAEVYVTGSTLVYNGRIDPESYNLFRRITAERGDDIETIQINSRGGEVRSAIKMGHWIYDRGVDVVVDTYCSSSCANYVFTAGRNKVIQENSIVGWHGSAQQYEYIARSLGISLEEYWRRHFNSSVMPQLPEGATLWTGNLDNPLNAEIREERAFLERVDVRVDALVYGLMPGRYDAYSGGEYSLWTFPIDDMGKFGIGNVSYAGAGEYPSADSLEQRGDIIVYPVAD